MDIQESRRQFEEHIIYVSRGLVDLSRNLHGEYDMPEVQNSWYTWENVRKASFIDVTKEPLI